MTEETNYASNNRVRLSGYVETIPEFSHELYGEGFYEFTLKVPRLSQQEDFIPITVSERLMVGVDFSIGNKLAMNGQFRSYNKLVDGKSKLMLTVFVRDFFDCGAEDKPNEVELLGYVCKQPIYRTTPFNREICDLLIAVNRAYNKSDYIPCIAWGRNARFVRDVAVGTRISINGRIQSRRYTKRISDEISEVRTAYELSIGKLTIDDSRYRDDEETADGQAFGDSIRYVFSNEETAAAAVDEGVQSKKEE